MEQRRRPVTGSMDGFVRGTGSPAPFRSAAGRIDSSRLRSANPAVSKANSPITRPRPQGRPSLSPAKPRVTLNRPAASRAQNIPMQAAAAMVKSTSGANEQTAKKRRFGFFGRKKSAPKKRSAKRIILQSSAAFAVLALLVGGWLGWQFFNNTGKVFGGNIATNLTSVFKPVPLKGQETGRVNILLAGNSADDVGHSGADLTDSIMIVSIDVKNNKAFMLSIPRDTWVEVPGAGHQKINAAYYYGKEADFSENGYAPGGMGMLEKVVEQNFGLDINYYALVNYTALRDAVNAVGGINYTVQSSDPRGLYDPNIDWTTRGPLVKLSNGVHQLSGQQALNLARARGDAYNSYGFPRSDFNRTENQRAILLALKDKALTAGTISNPLKLSNLFKAFGNNVQTDFKLNEINTLYGIVKKMPSGGVESVALVDEKQQLLKSYTAPGGQSALAPAAGVDDFSEITAYLQKLTSNSNSPAVDESPIAVVLNGSGKPGLARTNQTALAKKGFGVPEIGNATRTYAITTIIDLSGGKKTTAKSTLTKQYPGATFTSEKLETPTTTNADFIIILGQDQPAI